MNWLDIVIIIIGIIFGFLGLWKGAIKAAFSIAGLAGGIALAGHYYQPFAGILSSSGAIWAKIAAYAIIVVVMVVVGGVIGRIVRRFVGALSLGWLDRLIGALCGLAVGGMFCAALLTIMSKYLPGIEGTVSQSVLAQLLIDKFPLLLALLPEEFDFIRDIFG